MTRNNILPSAVRHVRVGWRLQFAAIVPKLSSLPFHRRGRSSMIPFSSARRMMFASVFGSFVVASITAADEASSASTDSGPVDELRIYHARPGTMEALVGRFRDHTRALFEKHGIESLGYWIDADAPETLIYVVRHADPKAIDSNWKAFGRDPQWKQVAKASGVGGLAKPLCDHSGPVGQALAGSPPTMSGFWQGVSHLPWGGRSAME